MSNEITCTLTKKEAYAVAELSMGGISPIDELKKINKKLPDIDTDCIIPLRAGRRRH